MTTPHLPTPDEFFISVLLDEWLEDCHCLDSPEAWDAVPKKPLSSEEIQEFLEYSGLSKVEDLGMLMMEQAHARIYDMIVETGINPKRLLQNLFHGASLGGDVSVTRRVLLQFKMNGKEIEAILRLTALCMNMLNGDWPFEYVGPSRASDADEAS